MFLIDNLHSSALSILILVDFDRQANITSTLLFLAYFYVVFAIVVL